MDPGGRQRYREIPICRIIYAHPDDQGTGGSLGWVSHLRNALENELRKRCGVLGYNCTVAMDTNDLSASLPRPGEAAFAALTYVPVVTHASLASKWSQEELAGISECEITLRGTP